MIYQSAKIPHKSSLKEEHILQMQLLCLTLATRLEQSMVEMVGVSSYFYAFLKVENPSDNFKLVGH